MKYPANDVTPHGWWHMVTGNHPTVRLRAYDGSVDFYMMGGAAIPDRYASPEAAHLVDIKGLIPPWQHIDLKGATQDGVTHIDALLDPIEIEAAVVCKGRDAARTRQVVRDLIASLDAKQEAELSWHTPDAGYWWSNVRWFKGAPADPLLGAQNRRQKLSLRLRADTGLWRTYDDTATFEFTYEAMTDTFDYDTYDEQDLGANWPQYYDGDGGGYCYAKDGQSRWRDDPDDPFTTQSREVVNGPYKDFSTTTDNQVINIVLGSIPEITLGDGAYTDLWGRMSRDGNGDWTGYGIRARIGINNVFPWVKLSRFNNFTETVLYERPMLVTPVMGEKFTLVCGQTGDPRLFKILRNGSTIVTHKEGGTGSALGSNYRGIGFGMHAGAALITQATPANVRKVSAGDNTAVTQSGFLTRTNIGDQPMYDDYTVFGPGTFKFWDGPNSDDYVEFGPLLPNQVAFLRTDPRKRGVKDLTVVPPTPQELTEFQAALQQFISWATANNVPPLLQEIESQFGILPPQGNMYSLLSGRFSDNAAIPPKSPGNPATPYYVKVEIVGGNADSRIIASGVPQRRYPL